MPASGPVFALQFLTVAPPLIRRPPRGPDFGSAEAFFPAIGIALGLGLVVIDAALTPLLAPAVRDVVLVAALALMTGALHLDGVVDTFDGIFGGPDPGARLAVMRDPRAGAFGVAALTLVLLLKVAALGALPSPARIPALILGPCLGRWAIVVATWLFPYARPEGSGRAFKDGIRQRHVAAAGLWSAGAAAFLAGATGIVLLIIATLVVGFLGRLMVERLGGLTGDTYGALCELTETGVWVGLGSHAVGLAA